MTEVIIYTTKICPYCTKAKMLLNKKKIKFKEIDASDIKVREEMVKKTGGRKTIPQIFINGKHIGGCDDLYELERENKLDELLK